MTFNPIPSNEQYPFSLPGLPYPADALEPYITENTISYHYGKHHLAYVNKLNELIKDSKYEGETLEKIIMDSHKHAEFAQIFNNAAQIWNHTFYWMSMTKDGGGEPSGKLAEQIAKDFGSFSSFKAQFKQAAVSQFGSGWAWLVWDGKALRITKTGNADLPMVHGQKAILTTDVWEHAYYLDYQNRRPDYVDEFLNHLVNWNFAAQNFES